MDKIKRSQLQKHIKMIKSGLEVVEDTIVIPFSSQTKQGREEIYELLDDMICHFYADDEEDEEAQNPKG